MTTNSAAEILERHLKALAAGDLDALMRDYANDAVFISGATVVRGRDALEKMFAGVAANPPKIVEDARAAEGDVAYIAWHNDQVAFGTDTFVIRDGKIVCQTVGMKV